MPELLPINQIAFNQAARMMPSSQHGDPPGDPPFRFILSAKLPVGKGLGNQIPLAHKDFISIWVFPKMVVHQNGWFIMENPIKMDGLFGGTTIFGNIHLLVKKALQSVPFQLRPLAALRLSTMPHLAV